MASIPIPGACSLHSVKNRGSFIKGVDQMPIFHWAFNTLKKASSNFLHWAIYTLTRNLEGGLEHESWGKLAPDFEFRFGAQVRLRTRTLPGNDLRQVVHTHVPLSPSSIIWYRSKDGDAPRLGR